MYSFHRGYSLGRFVPLRLLFRTFGHLRPLLSTWSRDFTHPGKPTNAPLPRRTGNGRRACYRNPAQIMGRYG